MFNNIPSFSQLILSLVESYKKRDILFPEDSFMKMICFKYKISEEDKERINNEFVKMIEQRVLDSILYFFSK